MTSKNSQSHKPSIAYYKQRWPHSLSSLPNQTSAKINRYTLLSWCHWAGLSSATQLRASGIAYEGVRRLAQRQEIRGRCNAYHNRSHIAQVIIASGLFAQQARLSQTDTDHLIIAALMHDYGHLGHFRNTAPFWQERQSWKTSMAILSRSGLDGRLVSPFHKWIMATSPAAHLDKARRQDTITALLVDADLFGSLFLAKPLVRRLSQSVRFEERLTTDLAVFIEQFIKQCETAGLASLAARQLHAQLPDGYSYFKGAS